MSNSRPIPVFLPASIGALSSFDVGYGMLNADYAQIQLEL